MSTTLERPAGATIPPPQLPEIPEIVFNGVPLVTDEPPVEHEPTESFHEVLQRATRLANEQQAQRIKAHQEHQQKRAFSERCEICLAAYYSCSTYRGAFLGGR